MTSRYSTESLKAVRQILAASPYSLPATAVAEKIGRSKGNVSRILKRLVAQDEAEQFIGWGTQGARVAMYHAAGRKVALDPTTNVKLVPGQGIDVSRSSQRADVPLRRVVKAKQLGIARDALVSALFGPARVLEAA